ncbi:MAG: DinB family protein [Armatimonadota bacterium]|nr:DinB family protein [Armatimonadota bacterium]MDR7452535.1 DinB family protein [Armatimonadota bacterium]MDR7467762.1 DinB family protein [Armatimonadota bacterium]MDR7494962.1 DinB family protein [Armatimonadota bacterium]MDR7499773.1 DinB family protein [Armatimonadota bacterium]
MTLIEQFLRSHAIVHDLGVGAPEGGFSLAHGRLRGLSEEQLRLRPQGWNSIAYLWWHMARSEDVATNVIVAGRAQLFDEGQWSERLQVPRRDIGTGMSDEEVEDLSRAVDIPALLAYRSAVGRRTREVVQALPEAEWGRVVEAALIQRAVEQGAFTPQSMWVAELWTGKMKGWFLCWVVVGHSYMHLGQAVWVKEMILQRRGR